MNLPPKVETNTFGEKINHKNLLQFDFPIYEVEEIVFDEDHTIVGWADYETHAEIRSVNAETKGYLVITAKIDTVDGEDEVQLIVAEDVYVDALREYAEREGVTFDQEKYHRIKKVLEH